MEIPIVIVFFTTWLGAIWGLHQLFKEADEVINIKTKNAVSKWLENVSKKKDIPNWPKYFAEIFDKIYTKKHWSIKCFFRSILSSIIIFVIFSLVHYIQFKSRGFIFFAFDSLRTILDSNEERIKYSHEIGIALYLSGGAVKSIPNYSELEKYDDNWINSIKSRSYFRDTILFLGDSAILQNNGVNLISNPVLLFDFEEIRELRSVYLTLYQKIKLNPLYKQQILKEAYQKFNQIEEIKKEQDKNNQIFDYIVKYTKSPYLIAYLFIFNLIIDYFSLLETRLLLSIMTKVNSISGKLALLALDILLTIIIFFIFWNIVFNIILALQDFFPSKNFQAETGYALLKNFSYNNIYDFININNQSSVVFYTTFFTSIWIWLFVLSGFIIKNLSRLNNSIFKIMTWFDLEKKPFSSIGFMSMILLSLPFIVWGLYLFASWVFKN